jgi:hypothetical protein
MGMSRGLKQRGRLQSSTEMTIEPVLVADTEVVRPGTSLFKPDTGDVFWYQKVEDESVYLEGVRRDVELAVDCFRSLITDGDLIVESQPPGYTERE